MADNPTYEANYFFRDYVTEDILSYCIGEVYLYHYKETLFGVRSARENIGYFADIETVPKQNSNYAPTVDQLTEAHIKEAIDEIDHSQEKTNYIPMSELPAMALEMVSREIAGMLDRKLLGEA